MIDQTLTAIEMRNSCICLGLRRAARAVSRRYDVAFRPLGLTSGQFSILGALLQNRPVPLGNLATMLGMDRTTLNRNLRPLEAADLIATRPDDTDQRVRALELTTKGHTILVKAIPLWREMQKATEDRLGQMPWQTVRGALNTLD